jgi:hypothetical protein
MRLDRLRDYLKKRFPDIPESQFMIKVGLLKDIMLAVRGLTRSDF